MKKSNLLGVLIGTMLLLSTSVVAVEFGDYVRLSSFDMNGEYIPYNYDVMPVSAVEQGQFKSSYLCTDATSRKVPGKVIDRKCWVEWKGNRYANEHFDALKIGNYEWLPITNRNANSMNSIIKSRGITNGGRDEDNYVFHCKIISQTGNTPFETHGKYLPSRNGCYYEYFGSKFAPMDQPDYGLYEPLQQLFVLVSPQTNPPWSGGNAGNGGGEEP